MDRFRTGLACSLAGLLIGLVLVAFGVGDLRLNATAGFFGAMLVWAVASRVYLAVALLRVGLRAAHSTAPQEDHR